MDDSGQPYDGSVADIIFNTIPQSAKLSLLVFGWEHSYSSRLAIHSDQETKPRLYFFRHQVTDPRMTGMKNSIAVAVDLDQAKILEPKCNVLDYRFPYNEDQDA